MSSQTHPPIRRDTPGEHTEPPHDILKPSAGFVIWGVVLLVLSPMAALPLFAAVSSGQLAYMDGNAIGFMGFVSTAGTLVGLVLLLVGIYRALTAVHVGAREAARASGRLSATPSEDGSIFVRR